MLGDQKSFIGATGETGLARWQLAAVADAPGELLVVLVHADQAAAEQNEKRLRSAVEEVRSSGVSVSSIDIDGNVLVGHLKSEKPLASKLSKPEGKLLLIADEYGA